MLEELIHFLLENSKGTFTVSWVTDNMARVDVQTTVIGDELTRYVLEHNLQASIVENQIAILVRMDQ